VNISSVPEMIEVYNCHMVFMVYFFLMIMELLNSSTPYVLFKKNYLSSGTAGVQVLCNVYSTFSIFCVGHYVGCSQQAATFVFEPMLILAIIKM